MGTTSPCIAAAVAATSMATFRPLSLTLAGTDLCLLREAIISKVAVHCILDQDRRLLPAAPWCNLLWQQWWWSLDPQAVATTSSAGGCRNASLYVEDLETNVNEAQLLDLSVRSGKWSLEEDCQPL